MHVFATLLQRVNSLDIHIPQELIDRKYMPLTQSDVINGIISSLAL